MKCLRLFADRGSWGTKYLVLAGVALALISGSSIAAISTDELSIGADVDPSQVVASLQVESLSPVACHTSDDFNGLFYDAGQRSPKHLLADSLASHVELWPMLKTALLHPLSRGQQDAAIAVAKRKIYQILGKTPDEAYEHLQNWLSPESELHFEAKKNLLELFYKFYVGREGVFDWIEGQARDLDQPDRMRVAFLNTLYDFIGSLPTVDKQINAFDRIDDLQQDRAEVVRKSVREKFQNISSHFAGRLDNLRRFNSDGEESGSIKAMKATRERHRRKLESAKMGGNEIEIAHAQETLDSDDIEIEKAEQEYVLIKTHLAAFQSLMASEDQVEGNNPDTMSPEIAAQFRSKDTGMEVDVVRQFRKYMQPGSRFSGRTRVHEPALRYGANRIGHAAGRLIDRSAHRFALSRHAGHWREAESVWIDLRAWVGNDYYSDEVRGLFAKSIFDMVKLGWGRTPDETDYADPKWFIRKLNSPIAEVRKYAVLALGLYSPSEEVISRLFGNRSVWSFMSVEEVSQLEDRAIRGSLLDQENIVKDAVAKAVVELVIKGWEGLSPEFRKAAALEIFDRVFDQGEHDEVRSLAISGLMYIWTKWLEETSLRVADVPDTLRMLHLPNDAMEKMEARRVEAMIIGLSTIIGIFYMRDMDWGNPVLAEYKNILARDPEQRTIARDKFAEILSLLPN